MTHSLKKLRAIIDAAYYDCERLCDANGRAQGAFREAYDHALTGERKHRAIGRRFTSGRCGYRAPADLAAKLFALRFFLQGATDKPEDVLEMRDDKRCAFVAARYCPPKAIAALRRTHHEAFALDYSAEFPR
jgi:hypothetical protein